ncbi:MAG: nucleotidyltransferase family protein [Ignavibacteriaceae bacterium]|nr:nucleotidyltransferase family protein [Ignavibacteriaceae bacterium]
MKAMIFAAGLGTRLKPLTDTLPKALIQIGGRTLLERVITKLIGEGVNELIINIHHLGSRIVDFIRERNSFGIRIEFSDESDLLLDTGGGLKKASWFFDDGKPFILYNSDIISDIDLNRMLVYHSGSEAIATLAVRERQTARYFLFDSENNLCGWKNIRSEEERIERIHSSPLRNLAFSGIHIIDPRLFSLFPDEVKFSMVDLYLKIASENIIKGFDHTGDIWIDIGKPESLQSAEKFLK